jgi:5,10-methylenetetrahydromethanopterin reductase
VTRKGIERLATDYDEGRHGQASAPHARQLEDEFIDRFALVGPAERVVERLAELASLGIERIVVVPGCVDADPALVADSNNRFAEEVLARLTRLEKS